MRQHTKERVLSNEEEEKVPNEHPPKRHSIGLNFYQTNYFTGGVDINKRQQTEGSDDGEL
jgi:hypothetical protein